MIQKQYTFANLPASCISEGIEADIAIIGIPHGVPYHTGELSPSHNAPDAIRIESNRYPDDIASWDFDLNTTMLAESRIRIIDFGNLEGNPNEPTANLKNGCHAIGEILRSGAIPIVLGGDDSIPLMAFLAFEDYQAINILQIDAHIDWRDDINGITAGFSSPMRRASELDWIDRIIQVGARGTGTARKEEYDAAQNYGACIITGYDLQKSGINSVLDLVPADKPCYVTIDCDGLDPAIMPGVMSPIPGGVSYYQMLDLIRGIQEKADLAGLNLVEYVPGKDINHLGAITAMRIIWNFIGEIAKKECKKPNL